jgi:hypothetical protein
MASLSPEVKQAINYTADRAAERAVKRTLMTVGINTLSGESIQESQRDMAMLRRFRLTMEARSSKVYMALLVAAMSLFNSLLVLGVQYLISHAGAPTP